MTDIEWCLDDLLPLESQIWHALQNAAASSRAPFHFATVATVANGDPRARTVVLRTVDSDTKTLEFHTDRRSPKYREISRQPAIAWLFYDQALKTQLRINARATLHHNDAISQSSWDHGNPGSHRCYCSHSAPGTKADHADSGLPEALLGGGVDYSSGYEQFVVVRTRVSEIDWLLLRGQGHVRARFCYGDPPSQTWLIP